MPNLHQPLTSSKPRLHLISVRELQDGIAPEKRAAMDLDKYADRLRSMCAVLRPMQYGLALSWISDWRLYCFERNITRWSDGKYYLLNRDYDLWRGHKIAFTRSELDAIGCDEWGRLAIRTLHKDSIVPLEADCFHLRPRRQFKRYAQLINNLADAVAGRCRS
jgi:hypothetical protein